MGNIDVGAADQFIRSVQDHWAKTDDEDTREAAAFAENIRGVDDWLESVAAGLHDQRGHIELSDWKRKFDWERKILIWGSGHVPKRFGLSATVQKLRVGHSTFDLPQDTEKACARIAQVLGEHLKLVRPA
jgi:hypothetical protein